jgi:hypothetical protein
LLGCLLVFSTVQAQIYTVKVEPAEVDALLSLKEPIQIPTYEMDGLSEADVKRLKDEDAKAVKAGNPPRVAVQQRRHISTSEQGVWTEAHGQKLWLLEIKSKNATLLSPLFDHLELGAAASMLVVGKARHQLVWGLNFSVRNMSTGSESTISFVSLNRSYTYRVFVEGAGSVINASWSVSGASGVAHFFQGKIFWI